MSNQWIGACGVIALFALLFLRVPVWAALMLVGLVGIVVPVVPGLLLVWLATGLWAYDHPNRWAWAVFALCGIVYAAGIVTQ